MHNLSTHDYIIAKSKLKILKDIKSQVFKSTILRNSEQVSNLNEDKLFSESRRKKFHSRANSDGAHSAYWL